MADQPLPTVTVVVINLDGRDYLEPCLRSVLDQDYPEDRVEVILIDNASTDGSVELVRERFPSVQVIVNDTNTGFAPAVNQGARAGSGEYLALINNDAVADPAWLRELITPMLFNERVACTGGLVLDAEGLTVDFAGGAAGWHGHGFPIGHGEPPPEDLRQGPTLFATGSSLATRRKLFLEIGGMDEDYFAFFEDVDYGWRLWILGHDVLFIPTSILYHRHHGTIERFGDARERYLLERNGLATLFKNYEDDRLARTFPAATILSMVRGVEEEGTDLGDYRITERAAGTRPEPIITDLTGAHLAAIRDFSLELDKWREKRDFVQARRRRADRELLPLFRHPLISNIPSERYHAILDQFVRTFDLLSAASAQQKILIVCADRLGERMAGPAIRAWEMAKLLAREHEVVLGTLAEPGLTSDRFGVEHLTPDKMRERIAWSEVIVTQGVTMWWYPEMVKSSAAIVIDLYDPFHIEALELRRHQPLQERWTFAKSDVQVVNQQLERGDLFLCASEKQRDFWLGQLASLGRINPATYDQDPDLRALLEVAPFGLPPEAPVQERSAIRGAVEGIGPDDLVFLWGGGIYNWFDPSTLIRGMAQAAEEDPRLRLFFLGTAHPNPEIPAMFRAGEALQTARSLGVLDKHVFFNEGWVPYEQRADWLLDADVGVSTHFLHIETELSYRTRILDYIWAGLPILCTEGDSLSRLVRTHDLGEVVRAEDPEDVARGILALADAGRRSDIQGRIAELAPEMTWEQALQPLVSFCRLPRRAPDLDPAARKRYVDRGPAGIFQRNPADLARRFVAVARERGWSTAAQMAKQTVRRRLGR
ncbi:MAG: glycosyltransferase [Actinobacteria bacterium]|nr:glycosyltransferase [Actinomycetota bacterium]